MSLPQEQHLKGPINCVFWDSPELVEDPIETRFLVLNTFNDESHFWRYLLKCKECGQLYFFEFNEHINWSGEGDGNDYQYSTWIPISQPQDAQSLNERSILELVDPTLIPRIQSDLTPDRKTIAHWVGK